MNLGKIYDTVMLNTNKTNHLIFADLSLRTDTSQFLKPMLHLRSCISQRQVEGTRVDVAAVSTLTVLTSGGQIDGTRRHLAVVLDELGVDIALLHMNTLRTDTIHSTSLMTDFSGDTYITT